MKTINSAVIGLSFVHRIYKFVFSSMVLEYAPLLLMLTTFYLDKTATSQKMPWSVCSSRRTFCCSRICQRTPEVLEAPQDKYKSIPAVPGTKAFSTVVPVDRSKVKSPCILLRARPSHFIFGPQKSPPGRYRNILAFASQRAVINQAGCAPLPARRRSKKPYPPEPNVTPAEKTLRVSSSSYLTC